jgi:glutamate-1-semialdehyde 2,1-aminomutase
MEELSEAYTRYSPKSAEMSEWAKRHLVDGISHSLRFIPPFPPRIVAASGARVQDEDGHDILDFWQGHFANILGHNPAVVTSELSRSFENGFGLQTGFADRLQGEVAELLKSRTGAERVRFTTSGSLSTMYAVMLSRAFTGRDLVMKVGGGWHGAQPWGLKGVGFQVSNAVGFQHMDSDGLPPNISDEVVVTGFNDTNLLQENFQQYGDRLACFIVEPFMGAGGLLPATREFLQTARELTHQYGAALILDEVIAGFRFRAGNLGSMYGVQPDLATFGKVVGGGMPVAAVAGNSELMGLAGRAGGGKVKFSGGTYSAHPSTLLAAKIFIEYLVEHEEEIYPRVAALGQKARRALEAAFAEEGIYACCTGEGNDDLPDSSLFMLHFPNEEGLRPSTPEELHNPARCDVAMREKILQLAMLLEDVHMLFGHGSLSTAHQDEDIEYLGESARRVARRIRATL